MKARSRCTALGSTLLFALFAGSRAFAAQAITHAEAGAAAEPMVMTIQLLAPPGTDLSGLDDLLAQAPGQPLSRAQVRRTLQLLDETGRFENVLAYTQPMPGGVALLVQLVPRLRLTAIGFHGNERLSDEALRQKTDLHPGDEYVPERVRAAAVAVEEAYHRAGYPSVQVTWDVAQNTLQAQVEFQVEEGEPLRVRRVEVTGEPVLPPDDLRAALGFEPGRLVDLDELDLGLRRLGRLYRKTAHFGAQVGPAVVTRVSGERADIAIPVQAGPRYSFAFRGNWTFSDRRLREALDYSGEEALDDAVLARLVERGARLLPPPRLLARQLRAQTLRRKPALGAEGSQARGAGGREWSAQEAPSKRSSRSTRTCPTGSSSSTSPESRASTAVS